MIAALNRLLPRILKPTLAEARNIWEKGRPGENRPSLAPVKTIVKRPIGCNSYWFLSLIPIGVTKSVQKSLLP
jgi:hypothetical protein